MISFYFDEMMSRAVAKAMERQGYQVIMAADVDMLDKDDDTDHLPFAMEQGLVLVTMDFGFAGRTQKRMDHAGLLCWTGVQNDYGGMIRALVEFAKNNTPETAKGRVF